MIVVPHRRAWTLAVGLAVTVASAPGRAEEHEAKPVESPTAPAASPATPPAAAPTTAPTPPPPQDEPPATPSPFPAPAGSAGTPAEGPVSPPWGPLHPTRLPSAGPREDERAGLFGLGLAVEFPMVGVTTTTGHDLIRYGYSLGGAVSTELAPALTLRAYSSFGRAFGGTVGIQWLGANGTLSRRQSATAWAFEVGGGLAYELRAIGRDLTPFIGADAGAALAGYRIDFAVDDPLTTQNNTPPITRTRTLDIHEAIDWSWIATGRLGLRFTMLRWLASEIDLRLSYWPGPGVPVTNTYTSLHVHTVDEPVWSLRTTFSVRLGI